MSLVRVPCAYRRVGTRMWYCNRTLVNGRRVERDYIVRVLKSAPYECTSSCVLPPTTTDLRADLPDLGGAI